MGRADDARRGRHSRPPTGPAHGLTSDSRRPAGPASLLSPRGLLPRPGALASACLLALGLLLGGAGPAAAQTVVMQVSNLDQANDGSVGLNSDHLFGITTGSHTLGYKLTRVDLEMQNTAATTPTFNVEIWDTTVTTKLGTLTQQGNLPTTFGSVQFTHSGIDLDAGTTYGVIIDVTASPSSDTKVRKTASANEDPLSGTGWSIGNNRLHRDATTEPVWVTVQNSVPKFEVHGHKKPQVSTPTPATPLVSNKDQSDDGSATLSNDLAQRFTTGSNTAGYRLSNVVFEMRNTATTTPTFDVEIWSNNASTRPGERLATLTQRDDLPSSFGDVRFEAGLLGSIRGFHLEPGTSYWVVMDVTAGASGSTGVKRTATDNEDPGKAAGFSIADGRIWRSATSTAWDTATNELQMAVHGSEKTAGPALSSAEVTDKTLTLTFDADLDPNSVPTRRQFTVKVAGVQRKIADVALGRTTVTLTLASAVSGHPTDSNARETVTVSYARNEYTPLRNQLGDDTLDFTDEAVTNNTTNRAPVFTPTTTNPVDHAVNAPGGTLVSSDVDRSGFSDPDGDTLDFSWSLSRDDTHDNYFEASNRFFFAAKNACKLSNLDPPLPLGLPRPRVTATLTATDPSGATASLTRGFLLIISDETGLSSCAALTSAVVTDSTLTLTYEGDAGDTETGGSDQKPVGLSASEFTVKVDGGVAALAATGAVAIGETTAASGRATTPVTLTLATPVYAGQAVTVSHRPGADPSSVGFTDEAVTNSATNHRPTATFDPEHLAKNAPPGVLVTVPIEFEDPDAGDTLTFAVTADRGDDVFDVVPVYEESRRIDQGAIVTEWLLSLMMKSACGLRAVEGLPARFDTSVTVTATDDGGAATAVTAVATTAWAPSDCPEVTGAVVDGSTLTLVYDEPLDERDGPNKDYFAVTVAGSDRGVTNTRVSGSTVVLTLASAVSAGQRVTVDYDYTYNPDVFQRLVRSEEGHRAGTFANVEATDISGDTAPPVLRGATIDGAVLEIMFDELLDPDSVPEAGAFAVTVNGNVVTLAPPETVTELRPAIGDPPVPQPPVTVVLNGPVSVVGDRAVLVLAAATSADDTVAVSYGKPTGAGAAPLRDLSGNEVANFGPETATEPLPLLRTAAVDGAALTLTFNRALDTGRTPPARAFTVAGTTAGVRSVAFDAANAARLVLTLSRAVTHDESGITVGYSQSAAGTAALRDTEGNRVADFTGESVTNETLPPPPALADAFVRGATLTLLYAVELDANSVPADSDFRVFVNACRACRAWKTWRCGTAGWC